MTRRFDIGNEGLGFELLEHWENEGRDLLLVTSDYTAVGALKPGDTIVRRTWAAAGAPHVYNEARPGATS